MAKMLVITPDLRINGANAVLINLLPYLVDLGYSLTVLASEGGELEKDFLPYAEIIIRTSVDRSGFDFYAFDTVFLNTSSVHYYACFFLNMDIPVYWWFHESEEQLGSTRENFIHLGLLSDNFQLLSVMPRVQDGLSRLYGVESEILPMPVPCAEDIEVEKNDKIVFLIPGAYTYIKGQDIMLRAISKLPEEIRNRCKFIFCGYRLLQQEKYYEQICSLADKMDCVEILGTLDRTEMNQKYTTATVVVAPSRIDSTPTTIVEAMSFRKLCLVSSGAGISQLMEDCVNGFVFENENVDELMKRILLICDMCDKLDAVANRGYEIYRSFFSPDATRKCLSEIIGSI